MFVMGFLHDVGYEFSAEPTEHQFVGSAILESSGYLFAGEIGLHGIPFAPTTNELLLLNIADLLTDSAGNVVTLHKRLNDIASRYGEESEQYRNAKIVAAETNEKLAGMDFISEFLDKYWDWDFS